MYERFSQNLKSVSFQHELSQDPALEDYGLVPWTHGVNTGDFSNTHIDKHV